MLSCLGEGTDCVDHFRRLERLLDNCITSGGLGLRLAEWLEHTGSQNDADGLMTGIRFNPVADLVARAIRQKDISYDNIGREAIQGGIHSLTVSYLFDIKTFFAKNTSTDALGVRAIIGQKNAGDQFFFFFGSLTFFCFLAGMIVPFEMMGAF